MPTIVNEKVSEQLRNLFEGQAGFNHTIEMTIEADEFPQFLADVAETLRKQGLDERKIQACLLVLCGVSIRPLSLL